MITLDASVVIAHLYPHDANHESATRYLQARAGEEFLIHSLNLAEVLIGGVRASRGPEMLTDLEAIGIHVADRQEGEALRLAHLRAGSGLKLPDCCALDTALTTRSTLATFDDALAQAARRRHVTVAPEPETEPLDPSDDDGMSCRSSHGSTMTDKDPEQMTGAGLADDGDADRGDPFRLPTGDQPACNGSDRWG